ncbi:MAG: hypothetical protein NZM43_09245 [Saprospiraceae bacterium]|nr:hypothetical protein [Saprospiraceae bacterium]MDW8484499.1 hypothetical protein [Saprospiraceae bacterium]
MHVTGRLGISYSDVLYETYLRQEDHLLGVILLFEPESGQADAPLAFQLLDHALQPEEEDFRNKRPTPWSSLLWCITVGNFGGSGCCRSCLPRC